MGVHAEGGCICGEIRYAVNSLPRWVIHCGCSFCQRATGGHYLVETMFPLENFKILSGTPKTHERISEGSGMAIKVHFCATCGTMLCSDFERYGEVTGVFGGTFDNPGWFPRKPENSMYIYLSEMADGMAIPAGFNVYYGHVLKKDGTPNSPQRFDRPTEITAEIRKAGLDFARANGEA